MAGPLIFDFVADTTTTTGTGDLTLANSTPTDGTVLPNDVLANNDTFIYSVKHRTAREWETGVGTFNTTGPKLVRTTVRRSSNAAAAVNFSAGTKDVRIAPVRDWASDWLHRTDTDANLRTSLVQSGQEGFPTDGFYLRRHNGTLAQSWGPIFPFTEPISGDFSWVNQGTATVSTTNGGIYLEDATSASSQFQHRLRTKTAPATPYTITAAFTMNAKWFDSAGQNARAGLAFRQSSDDKLHLFEVAIGSATTVTPQWFYSSSKWNSHNDNFNAYYDYAYTYPTGCVCWIRISDDGTNRKCWCSSDGQNWMLLHSVGRTDFLTANQVGFFVTPYDLGVGMTLLSWKET